MTEPRPALAERPDWVGTVRRQWAWLVTVLGVAAGVAVIASSHWLRGVVIVGAAVVVGGGLRFVLRDRAGLLKIRSLAFDVALYALLGGGILLLALVVPPLRPAIDR